jgi:hypothetical protein
MSGRGWRVSYWHRIVPRGFAVTRCKDFRTSAAAVRWMRANMHRLYFLSLGEVGR